LNNSSIYMIENSDEIMESYEDRLRRRREDIEK
jgi:hypothetical protein